MTTRPLPNPPWQPRRGIFEVDRPVRASTIVLAAVLLLVLTGVATAVIVALTDRGPSIDVQTDMRRVRYQCGAATVGRMDTSHPFIRDGQNYYPRYGGAPGYVAIVDRRTGHAECFL